MASTPRESWNCALKDGQEPTSHQEGGGGAVWGCIPTRGSSPTTPFRGDPSPRERRAASGHLPCAQEKPAPGPLSGPGPHLPSSAPGPLPGVTKQRRVLGQQEQPHRPGTGIKQPKFPASWVCMQRSKSELGVLGAGTPGGWEGGSVYGLSQPPVSPGTLGVTQPAPSPPVLRSSSHWMEGHPHPGDLTLRPLTSHPCRDLISAQSRCEFLSNRVWGAPHRPLTEVSGVYGVGCGVWSCALSRRASLQLPARPLGSGEVGAATRVGLGLRKRGTHVAPRLINYYIKHARSGPANRKVLITHFLGETGPSPYIPPLLTAPNGRLPAAATSRQAAAHEYSGVAMCFVKEQTPHFTFTLAVRSRNFPGPQRWGPRDGPGQPDHSRGSQPRLRGRGCQAFLPRPGEAGNAAEWTGQRCALPGPPWLLRLGSPSVGRAIVSPSQHKPPSCTPC